MTASPETPPRRKRRGEQAMVPDATFTSYYGRPVIKAPTWQARDIAGYFYLGGLSGASSVLGALAGATGRPNLARVSKVGAFGAIALGLVGLVDDLGRPSRFLNMLRVFKPTSPMSMGSWLLAGYAPATAVAAVSAITARVPRIGSAASVCAAATGPAIASYTAALMCDTAVPAWHEAYREMPFVFVGSSLAAASGLAMIAAPAGQTAPARRAALTGAAIELVASSAMKHRLGETLSAPYRSGASGAKLHAADALTAAGAVCGALLGRRSRVAAIASGTALLAGSALTRFAIFEAGVRSANDPAHTVGPQRERLANSSLD